VVLTRAQRVVAGVALALLVALLAVLAAGAALDPIASWRTREALRGLDGWEASFGSVDVRLRDLSYVVRDLRLEPTRDRSQLERVSVERAEVRVEPRPLLGGDVVARVRLDAPRVRLVKEVAEEGGPGMRRVRAVALPRSWPDALVVRLDLHDGEIVWTDATSERRPTLRLHEVEATLENFATDATLARSGPTSLDLSGRVQESGTLRASVDAEPAADGLDFSGRAELDALALTDVAAVVGARSDFVPEGGTFHATVQVRAEGGRITGEVRPVIEDPELSAEGDGVAAAAKGLAADATMELLAEDAKGVDDPALVGAFPLQGEVAEPAREIPTFLAIVAAALGRGLSEGLSVSPGSDEPTRVVGPREGSSP
jgi:hypothetical protein